MCVQTIGLHTHIRSKLRSRDGAFSLSLPPRRAYHRSTAPHAGEHDEHECERYGDNRSEWKRDAAGAQGGEETRDSTSGCRRSRAAATDERRDGNV